MSTPIRWLLESCCKHREGGSIQPAAGGTGRRVPAAMATIVHLNHLPGEKILRASRPLQLGRCWHVDDNRVAVAEDNYGFRATSRRTPTRMMRLICETAPRCRIDTVEPSTTAFAAQRRTAAFSRGRLRVVSARHCRDAIGQQPLATGRSTAGGSRTWPQPVGPPGACRRQKQRRRRWSYRMLVLPC